jgi:hypothetical protein
MNRFIFFIIFTSFLMLCAFFQQQSLSFKTFYQYSPRTKFVKHLPHIPKANAQLVKAMCLGEKRGIPKKTVQKFKDLQIMHLLTPSGLHFSSLYFPLKALTPKIFSNSVLTIALIFSPFLLGFFALKRVIIYHFIRQICRLNSSKLAFLFTFFVAGVCGSYKQSPLSFIYSFLFWGLIIGSHKMNKLFTMKALIFGQVMLAYFNTSSIFPIAHIMNFILTSIITAVFPLMFMNFFGGIFEWQQYILNFIAKFFYYLIELAHTCLQILPAYSISLWVLFIYFVVLFKCNRKILFYLLLLNSSELTPLNMSSRQVETPKTYKPFSANCQEGFINGDWYITNCKKTKKLSRL